MLTRIPYRSRFGEGSVFLDESGMIVHVHLPRDQRQVAESFSDLHRNARVGTDAPLASQFEAYFEGDRLPDEAGLLERVRWPELTPFRTAILRACAALPRGTAVSYADLAKRAGCPEPGKRGRAVGGTMRDNPLPLIVPCHRVVNADRKVGKYGGGPEMKRWLLQRERAADVRDL